MKRAYARHDARLACELYSLPKTHAAVAEMLTTLGHRTWRGRPISAQKVGRLLRRREHHDCQEDD